MIKKETLPKGWTVAKLGNLVITEKGKKPKRVSKEKTEECSIPYVNIKAFEKNIIDEYTDGVGCVICEDDDFLMVWDGSRSGYVGKAIKGALGSTLVRIKLPLLNQDYVYYFLQSKFIEINTRAKGVGIPHVDPNLLWNYDFPIAPLPEQTRILAKLEQLLTDLDKGIEYLETTKQQLKVYRQAVLKWAFEGKLINTDVKDGKLPSTWSIKSIKELGKVKGGKRLPPKHKYSENKTEFMYIMAGNLKNGTVTNTPTYIKKETFEALKNYRVTGGEVYITIVGACIGDAGIIPDNLGNAILTENAAKIIELNSITNKYLAYYINSGDCQKQIDSNILSATLGKLALTRIATIQIPTPGNVSEQNKIVQEIESRLSVCDKIEETIESGLQQAEALRLSIIKKAFEGKLVPQDPNDEPAEKLLERIRAAKGNGKPEKKEKVAKSEKSSKLKHATI